MPRDYRDRVINCQVNQSENITSETRFAHFSFSESPIIIMADMEVAVMRRKKNYYVNLTYEELKVLRAGMLWFRNQVIREGKPTEDIDELIKRIWK